ncbi:hypothetical protein OH784_11440 [Ectobacillus funiculus]|uniref:hypothetical protein n=1 Tax=Ectobacillus funiculus TaxID=137993 RepID=UPI00397A32A1
MTHILAEYSLDLPFGAFEVFAGIFLAFSVFRIPYLSYLKEAIIISLIISTVNFITFDIVHMPFHFGETISFVLLFILHIIFVKLTPWHSFIISLSGYLMGQLTLVILSVLSISLGFVTANQIMNVETIQIIYQGLTFIVAVMIGLALYKKNIGVVFISQKMKANPALKKINALIISSIILGFIVIQLAIYSFVHNMKGEYFIMIGFLIIFDIVLWAIYARSKKEHEIHYNQMDTRKFFN